MTTHTPDKFLECSAIRKTMIFNPPNEEYQFLKQYGNWKHIRKICQGSILGDEISNRLTNGAYGNSIHHMYSVIRFLQWTQASFKEFKSILEFGGGFGNLCRLFYLQGFSGKYTIYDLKEFSKLQEWFLRKDYNHSLEEGRIKLISNIDELYSENTDLFIALWSLSEVPDDFKEKVMRDIGTPKYIMIAYQDYFEGTNDNKIWFGQFIKDHAEYNFVNVEISHLPGNRYLFGKLKK